MSSSSAGVSLLDVGWTAFVLGAILCEHFSLLHQVAGITRR